MIKAFHKKICPLIDIEYEPIDSVETTVTKEKKVDDLDKEHVAREMILAIAEFISKNLSDDEREPFEKEFLRINEGSINSEVVFYTFMESILTMIYEAQPLDEVKDVLGLYKSREPFSSKKWKDAFNDADTACTAAFDKIDQKAIAEPDGGGQVRTHVLPSRGQCAQPPRPNLHGELAGALPLEVRGQGRRARNNSADS